MKKIVGVGLLSGVIMIVASLLLNPLFGMMFPLLQKEYANDSLFRLWTDPKMSLIFVHPLILGLILAWLWDKLHDMIDEKDKIRKALTFALMYSIITIPGMLITYSSFQISILMIVTWTVMMFVQVLVASLVYVRLIK